MNKRLIVLFILISVLIGTWAGVMSWGYLGGNWILSAAVGLAVALGSFFLCRLTGLYCKKGWDYFNAAMDRTSVEVLLGGMLGMLLGIAVGFILGYPFVVIDVAGEYIKFFSFFACGFLGLTIGRKKAYDFMNLLRPNNSKDSVALYRNDKVLDTSAIIDGRIYDVALSGFLEGQLVVPAFVIEELRHIADSSDYIRRSKGRRGLEILSKMQKHPGIKIWIYEGDFPEEREVDMKLLRLCKELDASIVTNDYNLNKVAELQGIKVLNVNELTNAVKVIVFPGETMKVNVIKEGKEDGQGVGYLEDGTMVVVENGQDEIGQEIEVMVTSVFQTAAGRMIFTRKSKEGSRINQTVQKLQEVNMFG
ncbi:MAG: TRAM domain-containing protein [Syntrophomonadaceae bacterium]|nr:TRAM domain-containing protein [Syntrophomonadaceae bacterium]